MAYSAEGGNGTLKGFCPLSIRNMKYFEMGPIWIFEEYYSEDLQKKKNLKYLGHFWLPDISHFCHLT